MLMKKRSGGLLEARDLCDEYVSFRANALDLLSSTPHFLKSACYHFMIKQFGKFAKKINLRVPWFVPSEYGGVGLPQRSYWIALRDNRGDEDGYLYFQDHSPSDKDKLICKSLYDQKIHFPSLGKYATWRFHSEFLKFIDGCHMIEQEPDFTYSALNLDCFLSGSEDPSLYYVDRDVDRIEQLRRNEKLWKVELKKLKGHAIMVKAPPIPERVQTYPIAQLRVPSKENTLETEIESPLEAVD